MDITAALTPREAAALSDPNRALDDATSQLEDAGRRQEAGIFEESLKLKNTLDFFEERGTAEQTFNWRLGAQS